MPNAMTDERRAEIRALLEAATPGPWTAGDDGIPASDVETAYIPKQKRCHGYGCDNKFICDLNDGEYHEYFNADEQTANARLIAATPTVIAELLGEIERLRNIQAAICSRVEVMQNPHAQMDIDEWLAGIIELLDEPQPITIGE